jgi:hypothetical protein
VNAPRPSRPPPKSLGGTFLAGAGGRLLPPSVPFRFFGAAVAFHLFAWLALLAGAPDWPQWRGGLGWTLAALHLATLGTLVASAIGASLQLLPVATRQPVRAQRLAGALWWAFVPGVAVLALGMGLARPVWIAAGAAAVLAALAAWAALLAANLRGARGMPGVVLHGWGALAALVLLAASALALVGLWLGQPLLGRDTARALHLVAGPFGLMGLLAFGLSYILLPMFALAGVPDERLQRLSGAAALVAIGLAAASAAAPEGLAASAAAPEGFAVAAAAPQTLAAAARWLALGLGSIALGLHWQLMRRTLATGMRRDLGRALPLMRVGWAALALALGLGGAHLLGAPVGRLFVVAVVAGWLLSFLFGVLQRILPFLASMHAAQGRKRPPTPSALTVDGALAWHLRGHLAALALLAAAAVADSAWLVAAAALAGTGGAIAFGAFFAVLLLRLRAAPTAAAAPTASPGTPPPP